MNLNKFSQTKSEFYHVVQMVRNHIAEKHFVSKIILSGSNSHERLGEAIDKFHIKCQIWRRFIPMLQSSSCISKTMFYRTQIDVYTSFNSIWRLHEWWTETIPYFLCTSYIFLLKASTAIKVISNCTPYLKLV